MEELNKNKMWVDLAHTTDQTAKEILTISNHVMISHVGIRDLQNWKRNKTIEFLKEIPKKFKKVLSNTLD